MQLVLKNVLMVTHLWLDNATKIVHQAKVKAESNATTLWKTCIWTELSKRWNLSLFLRENAKDRPKSMAFVSKTARNCQWWIVESLLALLTMKHALQELNPSPESSWQDWYIPSQSAMKSSLIRLKMLKVLGKCWKKLVKMSFRKMLGTLQVWSKILQSERKLF